MYDTFVLGKVIVIGRKAKQFRKWVVISRGSLQKQWKVMLVEFMR